MASVWYLGTASTRVVTVANWTTAGVPGVASDTVWNAFNGWSVDKSTLTTAQINLLTPLSEFDTSGADGPRPGSVVTTSAVPVLDEASLNERIDARIGSGTITGLTPATVGLGNVDNTSDANKPVSTDQAAAIGAKVAKLGNVVLVDDYIPAGINKATTDVAAYWRLAITAAGTGGVLKFSGAYKINSELQLLNFQTVEGDANFWGSGSGVTTNFLDFRGLTADSNGQRVGFRLAAANVFRQLLLVGPLTSPGFTEPGPAWGVASVTLPTPVTSSPKFEKVQFYKWTHGVHLYGAYYSSFTDCEWNLNTVGCYFDSCYNVKLVNPKITCRSADGTTSGVGIQIANAIRGLTVISGSIEDYSTAILSSSVGNTIVLHGVYFEAQHYVGATGIDMPDGGNGNAVTITGSSVYLLNHSRFVRFTHQTGSSLVGHGNKFLYNQYDTVGPDLATVPTNPVLIYEVASPTNSSVDLYGDNTYACYQGANQTWGYTDNFLTSGLPFGYNIRFPYKPSGDARAAYDLRGRVSVYPFRVVTAASTLLNTDTNILVNSASATTQKLPSITSQVPGRTIVIKNIGAGVVTVAPTEASGVTIDTGTTVLTGASAEFLLYAANWYLVASTAVAGTAITPTQVDVFSASGTWTKPTGAKRVELTLIGSGGGGGSGRRGAAGSVRCGGGGGGGGGLTNLVIDPADLTATVAVTVGAGGAGGAAVAVDDTNGNAGALGATTSFGAYAYASGAGGGGGGSATAGTAGAVGYGMGLGASGGIASGTGGVGGAAGVAGGAAGGGSGGGITSANAASAGGVGTVSRVSFSGGSGAAGAVDGAAPTSGPVPTVKGMPGSGGGGGASSITTAAQAGANGSGYGGGSGGGGASVNGFASGAGGNGAPGYVLIITTF